MAHLIIGGVVVAVVTALIFGKSEIVVRVLGRIFTIGVIVGAVVVGLIYYGKRDKPIKINPSAQAISECLNWKKPVGRDMTDEELVIRYRQVHGECSK